MLCYAMINEFLFNHGMKKVYQTLIVCICFHFKLTLSYLIHFQNRHMTSELCRKEALEKK